MTWLSWLIVIVPMIGILYAAFYSKRYVKDVADYLACGRVAGRYVISVGDMAAGLSVISFVAAAEANYQTGMAIGFWGAINTPLSVFLALTGYCVYRFRQTRCLSIGQFLELRYSRSFRIVAASIRTIAEMITNAIGPAVAVRFFIYFLGIPHEFQLFGWTIPSYGIIVAMLLTIALALIWPAGRISLLITDSIQGMISYPIFVIFVVFILSKISWFGDVAPVMLDRKPGESFLNPMDLSELRDFNLFALIVTMLGGVLNRASWIGNDTSGTARNPHEQKMASILGTWRNGFAYTMLSLISIFVITFMLVDRYAPEARDVRVRLSAKVAEEVIKNPETRAKVVANVSALPPAHHKIGVDAPYSRKINPDTAFLDTTLEAVRADKAAEAELAFQSDPAVATMTEVEKVESLEKLRKDKTGEANLIFQKFRSMYNQMMMPTLFAGLFSPFLMGLFTLLMVMLLISTDDSRIFNASSTIIQDVVVPLRKKEMSVPEHLRWLKGCTLGVTLFFFVVSIFFSQLDFINMFTTLMCSLWLGAAGPIMIGGLYTRFGTTFGAWSALLFGSGTSLTGLVLQRNWAKTIYPWLERHDYVEGVANFLTAASKPLNPYVRWEMDPIKFPVNSIEIYAMAMVLGLAAYVIGSLLTRKEGFNLDRLLHRGKYHPDGDVTVVLKPCKSCLYKSDVADGVCPVCGINKDKGKGDLNSVERETRYAARGIFGVSLFGSLQGIGGLVAFAAICRRASKLGVEQVEQRIWLVGVLAGVLAFSVLLLVTAAGLRRYARWAYRTTVVSHVSLLILYVRLSMKGVFNPYIPVVLLALISCAYYLGNSKARALFKSTLASSGRSAATSGKGTSSVWRDLYRTLIGITPEYTKGDKVIAWSVFLWSIVYGFGIMFCGSLLWNFISPWPSHNWGVYFFITTIVASLLVGTVSTVWFMTGGLIDMRAMFRDLKARVANPLDDGRVVGHVSLADKARFEELEQTGDGTPPA